MTAVSEWQVRQYAANVHMLAQQMRNKLRGTTMEETKVAERIGFDRLAAMSGESPTTRFAPTPNVEAEHTRRWVFPRPWRFARLSDDIDKLRMLHDPDSEYAKAGAAAYNREVDKRIYDAARGSASQGEASLTTVALPSAQKIAHGSTGLTKTKIINARIILEEAAGADLDMYGPLYFVYHPRDLLFLLSDSTLTTIEQVAVRSLMTGEAVPGLMGFTWIAYTGQTVSGTERFDIAYAKAGMAFGSNRSGRKERVDERADLSYATQIFLEDEFESVRVDDGLVVEVSNTTTATPS